MIKIYEAGGKDSCENLELLHNYLEAQGIKCILKQGYYTDPAIWLDNEKHIDQAREIVADWEKKRLSKIIHNNSKLPTVND